MCMPSTRWQWDRPLQRCAVIISPAASRRQRWYAVLSPGVTTTTSCPAMLPDKSSCVCCASVLLERRLYGRPRVEGCGFSRHLPYRMKDLPSVQSYRLPDNSPTFPLACVWCRRMPCFSQWLFVPFIDLSLNWVEDRVKVFIRSPVHLFTCLLTSLSILL
jgi:hypothetical protein